MTTYLGKKTMLIVTEPDDDLTKRAKVVIHGGYIDRVLGPGLDKRIPHNKLPKVSCPIVDTTTIDGRHDDAMFDVIQEQVDRALSVDVPRLIQALKALGATVEG